jgi:Fic family protein
MKIPRRPSTLSEILREFSVPERANRLPAILGAGIPPAPGGKYRHWDILRRIDPPEGLTSEEWWAGVKIARMPMLRSLSLYDKEGKPFQYAMPDPVLEMLHEIDRDASGQIAASEVITNPQTRDRYLQSSLIEEAITSSQLEGASSTREQAKAMIRSGREPLDGSERMILNNYRAIQLIGKFRNMRLSPKTVLQIHRTITEGTLGEDNQNYARQAGDNVNVYDNRDGTLLHVPPPAEQLEHRMGLMCNFANETETSGFLHPVLRSIILHFWLAYDHPFVDGNGRTARALFYWSMLSQGYWLSEYISISRILRNAPAKYARSFLYTETDENDLTYFIFYQLTVIRRAIKNLQEYLRRKTQEIRRTERMLRASVEINHRQLALLGHALRHPGFRYTIESHKTSHRVTYQTARTDLIDLAEKGLMIKAKSGRTFVFAPVWDLQERLQELS